MALDFFFLWARLKSGFGKGLISELKQALYSQDFKESFATSPTSFVRNRILTFPVLVLYLANLIKGSLQDELDQFFQAILKLDVSKRIVSRSAVCQARRKLSYKVFIALLDIICRFLNQHVDLATFKGFRVFAVDGSTLRLPDRQWLRDHFGVAKYARGKCRAISRLSLLHDVLNRVTYSAILGNYHTHEQSMAIQHLQTAQLPDNCLFLLDRGYVSFPLLRHILTLGHHFCVRAKTNLKIVKKLQRSGLAEDIFQYRPSLASKAQLGENNPLAKPFPVRLIRFQVGKETIFLMTSVCDQSISSRELKWLYHQRWQAEESYKVKKCRLALEEFSGLSAEVVLQDFHAKVFAESLTSALTLEVHEEVMAYCLTTCHEYQVSLTQALAKMKNTMVLLFLRKRTRSLLTDLKRLFLQCLVAIVPGRSYQRRGADHSGAKLQRPSMGYRRNR